MTKPMQAPQSAIVDPAIPLWPSGQGATPAPTRTAPPSALRMCLKSYLPTLAVIAFGLLFYIELNHYFIGMYQVRWTPIFGSFVAPFVVDMPTTLYFFAAVYVMVLIPYYLARPDKPSSAALTWRYLLRRLHKEAGSETVSEVERQAMLALLLKFIFVPFCIHGLLAYFSYLNGQAIVLTKAAGSPGLLANGWLAFYNTHFHYVILNVIFLIDFIPFVIGYLIQTKMLNNDIVSVDSTLLGWMACLICYPPLNVAIVMLLPFQVVDMVPTTPGMPAAVHLLLNVAMVACFGLYASASVSLGFKCSNLTNRGTVDSGLYGHIRHPAYFFKNLAWWLSAMPLFITMLQRNPLHAFWAVICLAGWTGIYVLRAITEERHMLAGNNGYLDYTRRVPYRFLPGVW